MSAMCGVWNAVGTHPLGADAMVQQMLAATSPRGSPQSVVLSECGTVSIGVTVREGTARTACVSSHSGR